MANKKQDSTGDNSGASSSPKRTRRTKAEIEAAMQEEQVNATEQEVPQASIPTPTPVVAKAPVDPFAAYPRKNFLPNKTVQLKPINNQAKWATLVKSPKDIPFLLKNTSRGFTLPEQLSKGGRLVEILDNITKYITPQFPQEPMTELEFFSKMLGTDLSFDKVENNFWRMQGKHVTDKRACPELKNETKNFNMEDPVHNIQLRILKANTFDICPSPSDLEGENRLSSWSFVITDLAQAEQAAASKVEKTKEAWLLFAEITTSKEKMVNLLKANNNIPPKEATKDWLVKETGKIINESTTNFYNLATDPYLQGKVFLIDAVQCNAITRKGELYYSDNGQSLGSQMETIAYFNAAENELFRERVANRIKNALSPVYY